MDKPSYLGLLNAIANGESAAECYLDAWIAVCTRDDVKGILSTVARREGEHGKSFAKRIDELGFCVQPRPDARQADKMAIAASCTFSDLEKFELLELGTAERTNTARNGRDVFAGMLDDVTIDIRTGELLGRYISEERDSGRLLRACRDALAAERAECSTPEAAAAPDVEARLARVERLLEEICARLPA